MSGMLRERCSCEVQLFEARNVFNSLWQTLVTVVRIKCYPVALLILDEIDISYCLRHA